MHCPKCGTAAGPNDRFCPQCGSPLQETCPQCGHSVSPEAKFCPNCGHALSPSPAPNPSQPSRQSTPAAPPPPPAAAPPPPPPRDAGERPPVFEYRGVLPRFGAALVDGLIMGLLGSAAGYLVSAGMISNIAQGPETLTTVYVLISLLGIIYQVGFEASGGTPGKKILGMHIVDKEGNKPGLGKSIIRNLLRIIDTLPFAYLLGIILVASSEKKQRLGDRAAGTYVVTK
ncbi:MAG: RDD family protein [Anaerolineae bacterium]